MGRALGIAINKSAEGFFGEDEADVTTTKFNSGYTDHVWVIAFCLNVCFRRFLT